MDSDVRKMVRANLEERATLHGSSEATAIERNDDGTLRVALRSEAGTQELLEVDQVLMATGRAPRTEGLRLDVCCPLSVFCLPCCGVSNTVTTKAHLSLIHI